MSWLLNVFSLLKCDFKGHFFPLVYSAFLTGATIISNNSSEEALLMTATVLFVKQYHKLTALPSAHGICLSEYLSIFPEHVV